MVRRLRRCRSGANGGGAGAGRARRRPAGAGSPGDARGSRRSPRRPCWAGGSRPRSPAPTTWPAARTQTAVTSGSLKTASVPRRKTTSIVAPAGHGQPARDLGDPLLDQGRRADRSGSGSSLQLDLVGDDVRAGAPPDAAEGDDAGIAGVDRSGQRPGTGCSRAGRRRRSGRWPGGAGPHGRRRPGSRSGPPGSAVRTPDRWPIRPTLSSGSTCSADDASDILDGPRLDHLDRALADLLGRLEDRPPGDRRGKASRDSPERQGGRQGHRGMGIVAAGVHHAVAAGSIGDGLGVGDSQGVDIGPERDAGTVAQPSGLGDEAAAGGGEPHVGAPLPRADRARYSVVRNSSRLGSGWTCRCRRNETQRSDCRSIWASIDACHSFMSSSPGRRSAGSPSSSSILPTTRAGFYHRWTAGRRIPPRLGIRADRAVRGPCRTTRAGRT